MSCVKLKAFKKPCVVLKSFKKKCVVLSTFFRFLPPPLCDLNPTSGVYQAGCEANIYVEICGLGTWTVSPTFYAGVFIANNFSMNGVFAFRIGTANSVGQGWLISNPNWLVKDGLEFLKCGDNLPTKLEVDEKNQIIKGVW